MVAVGGGAYPTSAHDYACANNADGTSAWRSADSLSTVASSIRHSPAVLVADDERRHVADGDAQLDRRMLPTAESMIASRTASSSPSALGGAMPPVNGKYYLERPQQLRRRMFSSELQKELQRDYALDALQRREAESNGTEASIIDEVRLVSFDMRKALFAPMSRRVATRTAAYRR